MVFTDISLGIEVLPPELKKAVLTINNQAPFEQTFSLSIRTTEDAALLRTGGYSEIPDTEWIFFIDPDQKEIKKIREITIKAEALKAVAIGIMIPDKAEYYGKNYEVIIRIAGKPGGGRVIGLALNPRLRLSTVKKVKSKNIKVKDKNRRRPEKPRVPR